MSRAIRYPIDLQKIPQEAALTPPMAQARDHLLGGVDRRMGSLMVELFVHPFCVVVLCCFTLLYFESSNICRIEEYYIRYGLNIICGIVISEVSQSG